MKNEVRVQFAIGQYTDLFTLVKQRKFKWYGHVTIMQCTVQGGRRRGRQRKRWDDNTKEWTGFELRDTLRRAGHAEGWSSLVKKTAMALPRATRLRDR
ncbi:UDP-glucuronosyltransferase 2a1-like [Plakobranchus ocellatus]|uniref:UDP-glucuronosyltransferase 2a1-like n=1 Tax=Plakobranchus ocellatus TaxID=259542 RepID=A0AAV4ABR3_9GAST|nr:UDP-glucuronosyltransferase 2a1-like [Plakobranchus ocellatus]